MSDPAPARFGLTYGLAAFGLWGLVPLYFKALLGRGVSYHEFVAQRILWSLLLLAALLVLARRWPDFVRCLRSGRVAVRLAVTALLIAGNWLLYIYAVSTEQVGETSLGYFVTPLVNVVLGVLVFRERLRPGQQVALVLATVGLLQEVIRAGEWPGIALGLALSFGFYGLIRKALPVDGLVGLSVETVLLTPAALAYLLWLADRQGLALGTIDRTTDLLLAASGAVTAVPLLCFGQAARRLPLTTIGFLQYLAPSVQLSLAVRVFHEAVPPARPITFAFIWAGLAVYSLDAVRAVRRARSVVPEPVAESV